MILLYRLSGPSGISLCYSFSSEVMDAEKVVIKKFLFLLSRLP